MCLLNLNWLLKIEAWSSGLDNDLINPTNPKIYAWSWVPGPVSKTTSPSSACWALVAGTSRVGVLDAAALGSSLVLCTPSLEVAYVGSDPSGWCASSPTGATTCG